jgi:hypothetical integral membrane protein (TIGR02206 family)
MKTFGSLHIALLTMIAVLATISVWVVRRNVRLLQVARWAIGGALAVNEIIWWTWRYAREGVHFGNLPLQLCDVAVWLAVLACFVDSRVVLEAAYFPGLAGAAMALLTPDLFSPWPTYPAIYFFVAHGGIVIAVATAVFGAQRRFRAASVWRAFAMILTYAAVVGTFDRLTGANYMYLMRKPAAGSLLDVMGPWPWYWVSGATAALAVFWLLWLPVRQPVRSEPGEPASAHAGRTASVGGAGR